MHRPPQRRSVVLTALAMMGMRSNPPARASSAPGAATSPAAAKQHAAVAPGALGAPRAPVDLDRIHRAGTEPGPPQPSTSKAAAPAAPAPVAAAKPAFGRGPCPDPKSRPCALPDQGHDRRQRQRSGKASTTRGARGRSTSRAACKTPAAHRFQQALPGGVNGTSSPLRVPLLLQQRAFGPQVLRPLR